MFKQAGFKFDRVKEIFPPFILYESAIHSFEQKKAMN